MRWSLYVGLALVGLVVALIFGLILVAVTPWGLLLCLPLVLTGLVPAAALWFYDKYFAGDLGTGDGMRWGMYLFLALVGLVIAGMCGVIVALCTSWGWIIYLLLAVTGLSPAVALLFYDKYWGPGSKAGG